MEHGVYSRGRFPVAPGQVSLGDRLADDLHASVGERIKIKGRPFTISGIYHSSTFFEDSGATLPLSTAQAIARRPGEATTMSEVSRKDQDMGGPYQPAARRESQASAFGLPTPSSPQRLCRCAGTG